MKITKVEAIPVRTPMRVFGDAYNEYPLGQFVLVRIETDEESLVGYGEAPCTVTVGFYGETLETSVVSIEKYLAPALIGQDPLNIRKATSIMDAAQGNAFLSKTGIDLALYDIAGKASKLPVSTILGGRQREKIRACSEIGIEDPPTMVKEAARLVNLGFRSIKLKAGKNMRAEMEGLRKIRDSVGSDVELRVDPNGGWSRLESIEAASTLRKCEVSYLEQPLPGWDLEGLAMIRNQTGVPIMADESVWTPHDVARLAETKACDIINIKITKTGGLKHALDLYATARAHGIPCVIGTELESCVAIGAKLQIASAFEDLPFACEFTELAFQQISLKEPQLKVENDGSIKVPSGPGLGVTPDLDAIEKGWVKNLL